MARMGFRGIYQAFIAGLKAQGCVLCRACYCYMPPEHQCPVTALLEAEQRRKAA